MKKTLPAILILLVSSFSIFAQSGLISEVSLAKQVESSSLIIEGKVISSNSTWNSSKTLIYTVNLVEVYKSFKGTSQDKIEIITLGGTVGDESLTVNPELTLKKDELGLFMLKESSASLTQGNSQFHPMYEIVSHSQGFYKYAIPENKAINPFSAYSGISQNFYQTIESYAKQKPQEKKHFDVDQAIEIKTKEQKKRAAPTINKIAPLNASAGTKTVLTITGDGFGTPQGEVFFPNADDGAKTYRNVPLTDILSWTNTKIEVYIPSHAGTGKILIQDATSQSQESSEVLTISFAISTAFDGVNTYIPSLVDASGQGGYVWHMTTSFDANSEAKSSFTRAFDTWVCSSLVNWEIGTTTSTDVAERDGENVIRFDKDDELPLGVAGLCLSYQLGCSGSDDNVAIVEMDLVLDKEANWNYGPELPSNNQVDFESVVLHELGHGLQLSHVLEENNIMYYSLTIGVAKRTLNDNAKAGSSFIMERSTTSGICSYEAMTATECSDSDDDGVADAQDQCPDTASGESVDSSGCSESQLDDDNDGVTNDKDICDDTPSGQSVNSNGCATSQLDTDNDGVTDDKDTCANTPAGQSVNSNGCATSQLDTDNDGVTDDKDTCGNTPSGQAVNSNGCATSQLDTDNDGVTDDKDTCGNTPSGRTVNSDGCATSQLDTDNDGVTDDKDACANTPSGQTVNSNGCSTSQLDTDNDGVTDDKDSCANTPSGQTVNSNGCATSQLDTDNDGVTDDKDTCANTPSGQTVNSNGCSTSQLDTDNDGVSDDKDTCANTPSGQAVNSNGCATSQLDTDNDGVTDDKDTCVNTPSGETVDADGCSDSQKDDDNDGIKNDIDRCPETIAGATVDSEGCSEAQTLGVEDQKLDKSIKFYPNPVSNILSIKTETIIIEKVEIYSYLGRKIDEIDSGFERMQTAHLAKGMYIIKIYSEKGTATRRLIKQ